jgi:hypothetical protein
MFYADSGESLKDIKDKLQIKRRAFSTKSCIIKENKSTTPLPSPTAHFMPTSAIQSNVTTPRTTLPITKAVVAQTCKICQKDILPFNGAINCHACKEKYHIQCAKSPLHQVSSCSSVEPIGCTDSCFPFT